MSAERRHYLKVALVIYALWIVSYQAVGRYAATLPTHDLTSLFDRSIPLVPAFIWPYELCYLLPLLPVFLVRDWHRFNRSIVAIMLLNAVAFVMYVTFPVAFPRPPLGDSLPESVLALEYAADFHPGANNLPSLHVAYAWLAYLVCRRQGLHRAAEATLAAVAVLVTLSTLFVKQHLIIDVAAGSAFTFAAWAASSRLYPLLCTATDPPRAALKQMLRRLAVVALYIIVFWAVLPAGLWFLGRTVDRWLALPLPDHPLLIMLTAASASVGLLLMGTAARQLAVRGRGLPISHLPPSVLVRSGPYRLCRHPIYVGFTLLWLGVALAVGSFGMTLVSTPVLVLAWKAYVRWLEEPALVRRFGADYTTYRARP